MSNRSCFLVAILSILVIGLAAQSPRFDVVSLKQNTTGQRPDSPPEFRPDGGFRVRNQPLRPLIGLAYPSITTIEGLPDWVAREHYDVIATASLSKPSRADRSAMFRALLADRMKFAAHIEAREQSVYELVLARKDGRLGPGLTPSDTDCVKILAEYEASGTTFSAPSDFKAPLPPCHMFTTGATLRNLRGDGLGRLGDLMQGDATMGVLALALRGATGRSVVDKTGLTGAYRITLNYDMLTAVRPPDATPPPNAGPPVFDAVRDQLGLKLESAKAAFEVLVVDHIERPTPD
jgi:uncharacterized protein (TIGR03435 family)